MKRSNPVVLFALAFLNVFLGKSGRDLAFEMTHFFEKHGSQVTCAFEIAVRIPPFFHVVAIVALAGAGFGLLRKVSDEKLTRLIILCLSADVAGLFLMLFGFFGGFWGGQVLEGP